jgi:hypothetical protein
MTWQANSRPTQHNSLAWSAGLSWQKSLPPLHAAATLQMLASISAAAAAVITAHWHCNMCTWQSHGARMQAGLQQQLTWITCLPPSGVNTVCVSAMFLNTRAQLS